MPTRRFSSTGRIRTFGEARPRPAAYDGNRMKTKELIDAIQKGDAKTAAALLDEDRSLLTAKSGNTSAILLALYHGHPEITQLFTERGAKLTLPEACAVGDTKRA